MLTLNSSLHTSKIVEVMCYERVMAFSMPRRSIRRCRMQRPSHLIQIKLILFCILFPSEKILDRSPPPFQSHHKLCHPIINCASQLVFLHCFSQPDFVHYKSASQHFYMNIVVRTPWHCNSYVCILDNELSERATGIGEKHNIG